MMHYRKGENVEEELSKEALPFDDCLAQGQEDFLWMKVKGGTKLNNVISFAKQALDKGEYRTIVWSGAGGGVLKTVSCAEIMKRSYPLYQLTRMCYATIEEHWKPQMDGLEELVASRKVPCLHILMTLDAIDESIRGVQKPNTTSDFWQDNASASTSSRQNAKVHKREGQSQRPRQNKPKQSRRTQNTAEQQRQEQPSGAIDATNNETQHQQQQQQQQQRQHQRQRYSDGQQRSNVGQQRRRDAPQRRSEGSQRQGDASQQPQQQQQQQTGNGEQFPAQKSENRVFKPRRTKTQQKQQHTQQHKAEHLANNVEMGSSTPAATIATLEAMDTN